ncbi:MAG: transposase [Bacteroidetes bacterium GWF2_33_38]|nr:MAG: transposase [Bacteroidetes bacterium GWF2_33_38]OFY72314.1 MAG: transposase [Bacteroidetes bacterium RIFOXYA12_FULL_33_9]OFY85650.1 MAG: transposase [Bacteroidetes bacterium RIFOXYA2_FULL_33_7]
MTDKFQHKYRIASARLQNWDYRWNAAYFVTICTKNRDNYFGKIVNQKMELSNVGLLANVLWFEINNHSENIELGEFVVMPNHVHGILIFNNDISDGSNVETRHALSLQTQTIGQMRFQNQGKNSLSSIVGAYKSAVTKHANRLGFDFAWQTRFHDHIVRDAKSFEKIQHYIYNNPLNWTDDKFFNSTVVANVSGVANVETRHALSLPPPMPPPPINQPNNQTKKQNQ